MNGISARLRQAVAFRAGNRCEYCQLAQEGQEAQFHIDHIVPRSEGSQTALSNLALSAIIRRLELAIRVDRHPDHWTRFDGMSLLGGALAGQKKFAEAEPLLIQVPRPARRPSVRPTAGS